MNRIILEPGDIHISTEATVIWTVLGSCVAVILYSKAHKQSAVCHAQLPQDLGSKKTCSESCPEPCYKEIRASNNNKYVFCSIKFMLRALNEQGISSYDLEAYIYGGANRLNIKVEGKSIGERNIEAARNCLKELKIPIKEEQTGGNKSRRIEYNTESGQIILKEN